MSDRQDEQLIGKILFKHYKLKKKKGEGSFGRIYICINIDTKEEYAIKLVSKNYFLFLILIQEERDTQRSLLEMEAYIKKYLSAFGIPEIKHYEYNTNYNIVI